MKSETASSRMLRAAALVVGALLASGCNTNRPSHIDQNLDTAITTAQARPELVPATDTKSFVAVVARNAMPTEAPIGNRVAAFASRLGDLYTPGENYLQAVAVWRECNDYLTTKAPLEDFVSRFVLLALAAKGVAPSPDSATQLSITVDRLELELEAGMFTCGLDVTMEVLGPDASNARYRRQFLTEATAADDDSDRLLVMAGPALALGLKEDKGAYAALEGAFMRFLDDLLNDQELWDALH
jgi:hypothetical protein